MMSPACNPSTVGGRGGWITWGQEFETTLANMGKPLSTKSKKISQAWWWVSVIPAAPKAEAGESLELGRQRLLWAEITPLHSGLGNKNGTLTQTTKENMYKEKNPRDTHSRYPVPPFSQETHTKQSSLFKIRTLSSSVGRITTLV